MGQPSAAIVEMALQIADSCARADVESNLAWTTADRDRWYDTTTVDEGAREGVELSIRYLSARGHLEHRPGALHLIRIKEEYR